MPISLTFLGEALISRMANELCERFLDLCGVPGQPAGFESVAGQEVRLLPYSGIGFDGASRVDMVFLLPNDRAIPFEIKLGATRLSKSRIDEEWLNGCDFSHGNKRFKGNMMSILERKFPESVGLDDLKVELPGNGQATLTSEWFVIARQSTLDSWQGERRPAFSDRVKLLAFESIVEAYGGQQTFNKLVRQMLSFDYYDSWVRGS